MAYLDANADAELLPTAWQAYVETLATYGNPSSRHALGQAAAALLASARARIGAQLAVSAAEVVLTSGGTEANALALHGVLAKRLRPHVVTSTIEHPSVGRALARLASREAITLTRVAPPRSGRLRAADVVEAVQEDTALVSVVLACNETGVLQPLAEIARALRAHPTMVHTDAVQAVGKQPLCVAALGVDLLSLSGHKVGAPGGTGALVGPGLRVLTPLIAGGGQEGGLRAGTENVAGAVALATALEAARDLDMVGLGAKRDALEKALSTALPDLEILGAEALRLQHTTCVRFPGVAADGLLMALDLAGIAVSTGSACSTGAIDPSPILLGMGLGADEAGEALRLSLGHSVDADEIARVATTLIATVRAARALAQRV